MKKINKKRLIIFFILILIIYLMIVFVIPFLKIPFGCQMQRFVIIGDTDFPDCVSGAANQANDIRMCIYAEGSADSCVQITSGKEINECNKLFNSFSDKSLFYGTNLKDYCIFTIAARLDSPELCEKIKNEYRQDECFTRIAFEKNFNPEICNKIPIEKFKNYCLNVHVGRDEKNASICININDTNLRFDCISLISRKHFENPCKTLESYPEEYNYCIGLVGE